MGVGTLTTDSSTSASAIITAISPKIARGPYRSESVPPTTLASGAATDPLAASSPVAEDSGNGDSSASAGESEAGDDHGGDSGPSGHSESRSDDGGDHRSGRDSGSSSGSGSGGSGSSGPDSGGSSEDDVHAAIESAGGPDTRSISFLTTADQDASLCVDVQRVRPVAVPTPTNGVRPAWEAYVLDNQGGELTGFKVFVDAETGAVLVR